MDNKKTVKLRCETCGKLHDQPLKLYEDGCLEGAEFAAYGSCVSWEQEELLPGQQLEMTVRAPFSCTVGDTFWTAYGQNQFVQAKLLSILSMEALEAKIRVEILQIRGCLDFVQPVSEEEKQRLREHHSYDYSGPYGDAPTPQLTWEENGILLVSNDMGGGDVSYEDSIYTDADGIDHRVMSWCRDFEGETYLVGDEVLGFHEDCPYQWENGLLIDRRQKIVMDCAEDLVEAVVPEGIVQLGWYSFYRREHLERIVIPDTVTNVHWAISDCPKLKEVILTGNSKLTEYQLSQLGMVQIRRIP